MLKMKTSVPTGAWSAIDCVGWVVRFATAAVDPLMRTPTLCADGEIVSLRRTEAGTLGFVHWIVKVARVVFASPARCGTGATPAPPAEQAVIAAASAPARLERATEQRMQGSSQANPGLLC